MPRQGAARAALLVLPRSAWHFLDDTMTEIGAPRPEVTPRPRVLVLLDPRGAFASVRARPLWALALTIVFAFAVVPPIVFLARTDAVVVVERALKKSGATEKIPKEQLAQTIQIGAKTLAVALPGGAVAKRALWCWFIGLLAWALLRSARPDQKIGPVMGAIAVGAAPLVVKDLLEAGAFWLQDPLLLDEQNAVLSNPAAWFAIDSQTEVSGALLKGLDFFDLWSCALMAMGANIVAGTRSWLPYFASFGAQILATVLGVIGAYFN